MTLMSVDDAVVSLSAENERLHTENAELREYLAAAHWEGHCGAEGVQAW